MHLVHIQEYPVLECADECAQLTTQSRGIIDRAKVGVDYEVSVVGDHGTVLPGCHPKLRYPSECPHPAFHKRSCVRQNLDRNLVIESRDNFFVIDHQHHSRCSVRDHLLSGVCSAPSLDRHEIPVDLVRTIEHDVDLRVL